MSRQRSVPDCFSSHQEMHDLGYYMASEIPEFKVEQLWISEMKKKGLTFSELSQKTGIHRQSLYACTSGAQPSLESAIRICYVLNLPFEKAFAFDPAHLYGVCFSGGNYIWINAETLEVLPEAERRKMKSWDEKKRSKYQILYRSLR